METVERLGPDGAGRAQDARAPVVAVPCPRSAFANALSARAGACRGFTLIEILVVISIIMFLMAFVVVAAVRFGKGARVEACKSLLQRIGIGLDRYYGRESNERLPGESGRIYPPVDLARSSGIDEQDRKNTINLYLYLKRLMTFQAGELRRDPDGETVIVDPWGSEVLYWATSKELAELGNFRLYSFGPDRKYGGDDDISLKEAQY